MMTMASTQQYMMIGFILLIGGTYGAPFVYGTNQIRVISTKDDSVIATVYHIPARFGPSLPSDGLRGVLARVTPADACGPVSPPPVDRNVTKWIAVIQWGGCRHTTQVMNVERAGYAAAIVGSLPQKDDPTVLYGNGNENTNISVVSVAFSDAEMLVSQYSYTNSLVEVELLFRDRNVGVRLVLLLVIFCLVAALVFCCLGIIYCISNKKEQPQFQLEAMLKAKTFQKGDYHDTCSICLVKFKSQEKIRVLPCEHTYHQACVDRWLIEHTPTCPLCKQNVFVVAANTGALPQSEMTEEDEEDGREGDHYGQQVANGDSHTELAGRLLPSEMAEARRAQVHRPHQATAGNPRTRQAGRVEESSEQETVEQQTVMLETTV